MKPTLSDVLSANHSYQLDVHTDLAVRAALGTAQRNDAAFESLGAQLASLDDQEAVFAVYEAVLQTHLFVGFPKTIYALRLLKKLGCEAPVGLDSQRTSEQILEDGESLCALIYGDAYSKLRRMMSSLHADFDRWMITTGYGRVLSRPGLSPRQRELSVLPVLADQEAWPQLLSHTLGARRCGAEQYEIWATLALWAKHTTLAKGEEAFRVVHRALSQPL